MANINRAILCPPYLFKTYPQFETYKSSKKFIRSFDYALLFIWKNDGTKSWKVNKDELRHIELKIKKGKQLKGTEAGQSREVTKLTKKYANTFRKNNFDSFGLIPGHCDLCGHKCPNRDNPPCRRKGMPSLEAIGIDVYRTLTSLNVKYEYPVENILTAVTMIVVREKQT